MQISHPEVTVHVIVPARNEEDCIGRCLASLVNQQGLDFRITMVDDGSTDRTRAIAESFPAVEVIAATEPEEGVIGKCNAVMAGARGSAATWLLFTDADTVHYPGSLAAAVQEAEERRVDLLSYSPEQEIISFPERILMPLVFAGLIRAFPPDRINDPRDPLAAANGQYILVRRAVYEALGGHRGASSNILEDVELARIFKGSGHKIWFRYGGGRVRARMYRNFPAMWEGWTKGLAMLFRHPLVLAAFYLAAFLAACLALIAAPMALKRDPAAGWALPAAALLIYLGFLYWIRRADFSWPSKMLSFLGLPLFASLLIRSYLHSHVRGEVTWKGRKYRQSAPRSSADSSTGEGSSS